MSHPRVRATSGKSKGKQRTGSLQFLDTHARKQADSPYWPFAHFKARNSPQSFFSRNRNANQANKDASVSSSSFARSFASRLLTFLAPAQASQAEAAATTTTAATATAAPMAAEASAAATRAESSSSSSSPVSLACALLVACKLGATASAAAAAAVASVG